MSHSSHTSLVGSIVERKAGTSVSPPGKASAKSGFPVAQHRSKSAFARAREEQKKAEGSSRLPRPPTVTKTAASSPLVRNSDDDEEEDSKAEVIAKASEDWRRQMEEDNQRRVENMSAEELEDAKQQILKQFGPDIAEILKQSRATRDNERVKAGIPSNKPVRPSTPRTEAKLLKSAIASRAASPDPMSPTRSDKQLRFAELTPKDVYVYESAPSSPPRKALALPAPSADDGPTVSLGQFKGIVPERSMESEDVLMKSPSPSHETSAETIETESTSLEPEEGTPEYIRRRFFPNVAPNDPSLAWIEGSPNPTSTLDPGLRFDLTGTPIPPELSRTLPAHLGLHHHAEGTHAGYTLEDIFMLSRSTVPAQRAAMLGILSSIILKLSSGSIHQLLGQESLLRKRALAIAVEALHERGSVGVRAVELLWSSIVAWDADSNSIDGIELKNPSDDTFDALPLEYLMKQVSEDFETGALPEESQLQLLSVVHRLARHSDTAATVIINTPKLVANLLKRFLLLPITDAQPTPAALDVLNTLCISSRSNASVIADSAPTLLRFIVILPDSSLYPVPLATSLLVGTLRLYRTLASYGLCSQLATTASEHFGRLTQFVLSPACTSTELSHAWLELIEAWTVCAVDPHRTTPEHDILWTQVVGWEWGRDVLELRTRLNEDDQETWAALWRAEAAWLEGCSVNGVKGGETEKSFSIDRLRGGFEQGNERRVLERAGQELGSLLGSMSPEDTKSTDAWKQLSRTSEVLASAIRLWLSCLPPQLTGPVETPPFFLPVPQISALCAQLTAHPLWTAIDSPTLTNAAHVHIRPLSVLLSSYLYLSRTSPGIPPALWLAQVSSIICRLRPGDEDQAVFILNAMSQVLTADVLQLFGWPASDHSGLGAILPLLIYSVEHASTRIGPLWPSPSSIQKAETQRLPHTDDKKVKFALPLPKDWIFFPLDHLLRSGQTEAFKSLPSSWNYSEVDIARATLLLAKVHRHALVTYQLDAFALSREETVFSCMKVFMLEHEQQQETSLQEVFRDSVVNRLMEDLLEPFTFGAVSTYRSAPDGDNANTQHTLEHVSKRFLGEGTPFYQYYTDFVALYDSISFSHPLFARLLLPPVSMRYPVDYRKYLWADYSHVLRTIRVPLESVIASKLEEYLWPVEDSPEVLAAYLRSLVKGQTEGIIRFIAIHHVASNIWPDLRQEAGNDERATKLLQALVSQAGVDAIKDVVSYRQRHELPLVPPHCFGDLREVKDVRKTFAAKCGQQVEERLEQLLA